MRISELLRLVIINLSQNKFKVILTSVGIIVGSATIMMVLAIGTGGKLEVAEQFKNLNAGAIDISYESNAMAFGGRGGGGGMPGGGMPGG
ncbi:MAG: macrolide ABC transporter ATP-binding protein, partial [Lachnospiraceae bacterium]|nr:macrolide ABC transporter ATP-binding protein [Lachnospiraceae bacterium]